MITLEKLKAMPEPEFQEFFKSLPARVQLLVRGGMVEWQKVLPEWYEKLNKEKNHAQKSI